MVKPISYEVFKKNSQVSEAKLGAEAPINAISKRIERALLNAENQDPLVVGLYGEWGSGKTYWLKSIRHRLLADNASDAKPLIIPILFNAWRFEKETHLIVPLLKATATEFERWSQFLFVDKKEESPLKDISKSIAISASALAYSFAKSVSEDVLKFNIFGTLEEAKKLENNWLSMFSNKPDEGAFVSNLNNYVDATRALESKYYDFHQDMEALLNQQDFPIRLLFLIDDLDRCLPEKAVEMLESIKLFLEVKGTAFVVAVDDEIIERGIAYRYRDYSTSNIGFNSDQYGTGFLSQTPISGHEYLEKIITLPVRINRPGDNLVGEFILHSGKCEALKQLVDMEQNQFESSDKHFQDSFKNILSVVPPVPRKLIRLSESFGLRKEVLQIDSLEDSLLLLRVVALQLFAPEAYRIAQKWLPGIFSQMQYWKDNEPYSNAWPSFSKILTEREKLESQGNFQEGPDDRKTWDLVYTPLLVEMDRTQQHRSGFNPSNFIQNWQPLPSIQWRRFFSVESLSEEASIFSEEDRNSKEPFTAEKQSEDMEPKILDASFYTPNEKSAPKQDKPFSEIDVVENTTQRFREPKNASTNNESESSGKSKLIKATIGPRENLDLEDNAPSSSPKKVIHHKVQSKMAKASKKVKDPNVWWTELGYVKNEDDLFRNLVNNSEVTWQQGLSQFKYGEKLGPELSERLLKRFTDNLPSYKSTSTRKWLATMCRILTPEWIPKFAEADGTPPKSIDDYVRRLTGGEIEEEDINKGIILGHLGDPREGVGLKDGLPHHKFIEVPTFDSEGFYPGYKNTEEVQEHIEFYKQFDQKSHFKNELDIDALSIKNILSAEPDSKIWQEPIPPFEISCFPVTVAQFRCFFNDIENVLKRFKSRVEPELFDQFVANIKVDEWRENINSSNPNQPVVFVNWFQANAYIEWLNESLGTVSKRKFRLPSLREWEWVALKAWPTVEPDNYHPELGRLFPFNNGFQAVTHANIVQSEFGKTTPVGMFPRQKEQSVYPGIFDLCGNCQDIVLARPDNDNYSMKEWWNYSGPVIYAGGGFDRDILQLLELYETHDPFVMLPSGGFRLARSI